jgi:hypothetical protein
MLNLPKLMMVTVFLLVQTVSAQNTSEGDQSELIKSLVQRIESLEKRVTDLEAKTATVPAPRRRDQSVQSQE